LSDSIVVHENGNLKSAFTTKYAPTSIAATSNGIVIVGGDDNKAHLLKYENGNLKEDGILEGNKGPVTAVAISPDASKLVAGDTAGKVMLFEIIKREVITSRWTFHTGRIHSLAWTPDGQHVASGSLDTNVYVWSISKPLKNIALKNVGPGGVFAVQWIDEKNNKLATAGADGCVRVFSITFHT